MYKNNIRKLFISFLSILFAFNSNLLAQASIVATGGSSQGQRAFILLEEPTLDAETEALLKKEQELLNQMEQETTPMAEETEEIITETKAVEPEIIQNEEEFIDKQMAASNKATKPILLQPATNMEKLRRELQETRDRLMVAETEVNRLERVLDKKHSQELKKLSSQRNRNANIPVKDSATNNKEHPIAIVISKDAKLRSGPGAQNSVLLKVPQNARLTVETRKGSWYRISTPSGIRGWISSQQVHFGKDSLSLPSKTIRISGYDSALE